MNDQEMRQRRNRMAVAGSTRRLLKIIPHIADQPVRVALGPERAAHLIVGIGFGLGKLIERFVHVKDRAVATAAQVEIVKDGGGTGVTTAEFKDIPA